MQPLMYTMSPEHPKMSALPSLVPSFIALKHCTHLQPQFGIGHDYHLHLLLYLVSSLPNHVHACHGLVSRSKTLVFSLPNHAHDCHGQGLAVKVSAITIMHRPAPLQTSAEAVGTTSFWLGVH